MNTNRKVVYGIPALILITTVLWNEKWSYWYLSHQWPIHKDEGDCDRILLVADPQLIGYKREKFGAIARWDSDRYLSTGFSYAKWAFQPNAIIFLGDLFDEGLDASDDDWNETYERFVNIFPIGKSENVIYIPGDNDIGGEAEVINQVVRTKFYNYFRNNVTRLDMFYNINETYLFESNHIKVLTKTHKNHPTANILLTHVSFLSGAYKYTNFGKNMDLILSAHDHTTGIYEIQRDGPKAVLWSKVTNEYPTYFKNIGPYEPQIELQTPTCSYRMGVPSMGYGALSICRLPSSYRSTQLQYSVFWLPARFVQLFLYVSMLVFSIFWVLFYKCCRRSRRYKWLY